jgi:hypothetical protein
MIDLHCLMLEAAEVEVKFLIKQKTPFKYYDRSFLRC